MKHLLLLAITFAVAGCKDPIEAYQSVLVDNTWRYAGEDCSPYGNVSFSSGEGSGSGSGSVQVQDCPAEECVFVSPFDWRLDEDGLLTVEYDTENSAYLNTCGLPENVTDTQMIAEDTRMLTLQNHPFAP